MTKRNILFLIFTLLFFSGINNVLIGNEVEDNITDSVLIQPHESGVELSVAEDFIIQNISYYAPRSGYVFLVWYTENYPLEESVFWNDDTKLTEGLLYTPLLADGDTFEIQLKVKTGTQLQYNFWITKNKQGHYQDYWDLQSSGKTTASNTVSITKSANYSLKEPARNISIIDFGWVILLLFIVIYILFYWAQKKWNVKIEAPTIIEKLLFLGLSLLAFHFLARAEIISIHPKNLIHNPGYIVKIFRASWSDFLYVTCILSVFIVFLLLIKNEKFRKWIYGIFVILAVFSALVAFVNIITVIYLGKPFTYQWLYYSDFLGSSDAKTALKENLSFSIFANLTSLVFALMILAKVFRYIFLFLKTQTIAKYFTFVSIGLIVTFIIVKAFKTEKNWTNGQSENAIVTMVSSIFTANSNSSLFFSENHEILNAFDPKEGEMLEKPIVELENKEVKNVLFVVLESAGSVYFDGYGGSFDLSPNLNKYTNQSLKFEQMYAHAPATNRTLVSVLGSMYPHLSYKSLTQEAPDLVRPTLSSVLKNHNYRTSFFSSANLEFQNCFQFLSHREFDCVEDYSSIKCAEEFQLDNSDYIEGDGIDDMCLAERLSSWIDEDTSKTFFSVIWTVQGHYPYFFGQEEKDFGVSNYNFNRYLNCLNYNDELVGRVMKILEERNLANKTLVIVVGDHGEAFGQHGQYGHGTSLYEENLKVPLYFINPVLFRGETKTDIAGMKDLAPTVLSIINIEIPEEWQGRNLLTTNSDEAFFFAPWSDYLFGYRKKNMKYIFNETQNTVEVYDLNSDPGEKLNLINSGMEQEVSNARKRVASWVQFQHGYVNQMLENEN